MVQSLPAHKLKPTSAPSCRPRAARLDDGVLVATVQGVTEQTDQISDSVNAAIKEASDSLAVDQEHWTRLGLHREAGPTIGEGFLTELVEGFDKAVGLASGLILGALIMYYLLKDEHSSAAPSSRSSTRSTAIRSTNSSATPPILRDYGRGRSVMSAVVAVVIGVASLLMGLPLVFTIMVANFIGGYIPYIGAFLGGGLAVIVAGGEGGLPSLPSCSWSCWPPTCCWRTSLNPR